MTMRDASTLVRKLWQYCNVLRDDGLSYPDYVEQLTYLLFLKMAHEQGHATIPRQFSWPSLARRDAEEMHRHYSRVLAALGRRPGMLGLIFRNATNKIKDPAKLRLLVIDLIGRTDWTGLAPDVKGDAYEGLLEKNARDTKSGAGQYFTPRPLVEAIVECVAPAPGETICDPACGTAGFLLAASDYIRARNPRLTPAQQRHLTTRALRGFELVEEVARLATMNLFLHGIGGEADDELPIVCVDSLRDTARTHFDVVLTNPPFGIKGSVSYTRDRSAPGGADDLNVVRNDFWVQTANKQLNFVQHIASLLAPGGRAAVIVPDNVLFEGGAAAVVRRKLLQTCEVHTLLRLPAGLFYAQSVKANVIFFDKPGSRSRKRRSDLWVYDLRTAKRFSLKTNPLRREDLRDFVAAYRSRTRHRSDVAAEAGRWSPFRTSDLLGSRDCRLDLTCDVGTGELKANGLARLRELSLQISDDLERALAHIRNAT